jgi:hypothetical protein
MLFLAMHTEVKIILWPTVNQPVCHGVRHPSGAHDQIFISVRQLWVCYCGPPSLMRWVCSLKMLLGVSSPVIFGSESKTDDHILLSQIWDFLQPLKSGPYTSMYIPQEWGGRVIIPDAGFWTDHYRVCHRSWSHVVTYCSQSLCMFWCWVPSCPICGLLTVWHILFYPCGIPSLRRRWACHLLVTVCNSKLVVSI